MNNFWQRLFTGAVFTGTLVACIILSGWYLYVVIGLLAILTLQEFYQLFEKSSYSPTTILGTLWGFVLYLVFVLLLTEGPGSEMHRHLMLTLILMLFLTFPLIALIELFRKKETPFQNIGLTITGIFYVIFPLALLVSMSVGMSDDRMVTPTMENKIWPVLAIFLIVWSNDTFAYLVGKKWGKTKLFERISPKKSWEGFFGGLVFALICGNIIGYFQDGAYLEYSVYAVIISCLGTIGDLVESMLKRSLGVKDSGKILPGHGGLLDRLDAVLFSIPFIFVVHQLFF